MHAQSGPGPEVASSSLTNAERSAKLSQANKGLPLTNEHLWLAVIGATARRRLTQHLKIGERQNIINACLNPREQRDVSVLQIMEQAGLGEIQDKMLTSFLSKVTFNYDYQKGGEKRLDRALAALNSGELTTLNEQPDWLGAEEWTDRHRMPHIAHTSVEHHDLRSWVLLEYNVLLSEQLISRLIRVEGRENDPLQGYRLTGCRGDFPNPVRAHEANGWGRLGGVVREVMWEVSPLLREGELYKAGRSRIYRHMEQAPSIVKAAVIS